VRPDDQVAEQAVNTIRFLAVDAVQKANSGHPGFPLGAADYAFTLWTQFLRLNPADPQWPNRDRFVLSAGHGSMLLYALLHLSGFDLPLEELKNFRQLHSKTPGHPEYGQTPGVETTTGPLGQGLGNAVGMALASQLLAARFNREGFPIVDHQVYAIVSDGDLMEGIASEAGSLAGHLGLGNIVCLYDDNRITIEGSTELTFSEDVGQRFEAFGWHVLHIDGHDRQQAAKALEEARNERGRPSLIVARTHIAYGSPNLQDDAKSHGAPLGEDEVIATKRNLGWPEEPAFYIPDEVRDLFADRRQEWAARYDEWQTLFARYRRAHPDLAELWDAIHAEELPADLTQTLIEAASSEDDATRNHSGNTLQKIAEVLPQVVGGSGDLAPSTKTILKEYEHVGPGAFEGRNLHFGIREHAMGAILSGMALYGGLIPYGATFLVFCDYMRPSIRLAALMGLRVIYVFTHDSIFVGEDGPTHEPVEQCAALRAIPDLNVFRPADGRETAAAWAAALQRTDGPTALLLTRQKLPTLERSSTDYAQGALRGGYVLADPPSGEPQAILIATGSEVHLALGAHEKLLTEGLPTRVVSLPCWELFEAQDEAYRNEVLPASLPRAAIEAGVSQGWERYIGLDGLFIGVERYGASAPYQDLAVEYGLTVDNVLARVRAWLGRQ